MTYRTQMRRPAALLTGVVLLVAAATAAAGAGTRRPAPHLQAFGSCGARLDYAKAPAAQAAGSGGVVPVAGAVSADSGRAAAPDYSTTNVQEAGVDEPDIVKTDGAHLFAVAGGKLYAVDVRAAKPRVL